MRQTWKEAIASKKFLLSLFGWILGLALFISLLPHFLTGVLAEKPGKQLDDFVLNFFRPRDWSVEIFILIFGAPALFFIANLRSPEKILLSIQCYVVVNFLRMLSLYVFTLEAPVGIIPLVDPFLTKVAYGGHEVFVKDLFFSGHTSTLYIIYLIEKKKILKGILLVAMLLVILFLLWQRVHYSVDIVGAIFVTFAVHYGFTNWNSYKSLKRANFLQKD
jgi:PAP2 superfamily C-terminal